MGFYWSSIFYKDENSEGIKLDTPFNDTGLMIAEHDIKSFLAKYGHLVKEEDITEHSYVEENHYNTYTGGSIIRVGFNMSE